MCNLSVSFLSLSPLKWGNISEGFRKPNRLEKLVKYQKKPIEVRERYYVHKSTNFPLR